jgi:hypothetical protein
MDDMEEDIDYNSGASDEWASELSTQYEMEEPSMDESV